VCTLIALTLRDLQLANTTPLPFSPNCPRSPIHREIRELNNDGRSTDKSEPKRRITKEGTEPSKPQPNKDDRKNNTGHPGLRSHDRNKDRLPTTITVRPSIRHHRTREGLQEASRVFFDREASGLATGVIVETQRSSGRVTPQTRGGNRHMDIPGNRPNEKANNDTDRAYDEGL